MHKFSQNIQNNRDSIKEDCSEAGNSGKCDKDNYILKKDRDTC